MTTTLQQQARALGDPTRHAIHRYLADANRPVGVAELTAHFEFNHNAVRQHLAKLVNAELIVESLAAATGPGRRRLVYEVNLAADSRWGTTGPYERLSLLLAEIIRTGGTPVEVGRRAGQRYRSTTALTGDGVADVASAMASQGFDPQIRRSKNRADVVLRQCPFQSTALADPDAVCALHLGIVEGIAEGSNVVVDELVAKDPRRAKCRLRLHVEAAP